MEPKHKRLCDKLFAAARESQPEDSVPFGFETRMMARLRDRKPRSAVDLWGSALWRAAGACLLVTALSAAWIIWSPEQAGNGGEFAAQFEEAVFVAAESQLDEAW